MGNRDGVRGEIREFLTTRRAKITPEQAGLRFYGRNRRVPGLRREEVALLAGISIEYYTRLERGNATGVSTDVLDAIARALQLDDVEREHLTDLVRTANAARPARRRTAPQRVRPSVQHVLDSMTGAAAFVRNGRLDILSANRLGYALYSPVFASPMRPVNPARSRRTLSTCSPALTAKGGTMPVRPAPPTAKGPADWFTGDVWIDAIARGEEPSRVRVSAVRFTPSARTAWHSHAVGQTLYVTEGRGLHQPRDGQIEEIRAGDIVYTPAGQWHWHGASPGHFMTHLSITEAVPGGQQPEADWGEHVTDSEYGTS